MHMSIQAFPSYSGTNKNRLADSWNLKNKTTCTIHGQAAFKGCWKKLTTWHTFIGCQILTHDRSSRYQGEALGECYVCVCVCVCVFLSVCCCEPVQIHILASIYCRCAHISKILTVCFSHITTVYTGTKVCLHAVCVCVRRLHQMHTHTCPSWINAQPG